MHSRSLELIKHKVGFRLTIVLGSGISREWCDRVMKSFRGTYEKLLEEGFVVRVYGRPVLRRYPMVRIDCYYRMEYEQWFAFLEGQYTDKGQFAEEKWWEDPEDGTERAARSEKATYVEEVDDA